LYTGKLPDFWQGTNPPDNIWNGSKNQWLESLVNRAQAKGVKVSICVGGDNTYFPQATHSANLTTFVSNIVDFVNVHGFDGVDIDWERPRNLTEWNQCIALLESLRDEMPTKRITIALPHSAWFYPDTINHTEQKNILDAVHGIHLMTYDEGDSAWPSHSNVTRSIQANPISPQFYERPPGLNILT
jgi:GH18 family chitinase